MSEEPDFDVIVIGAGVAGSVCAYQLAQAGYEVALVERGEEAGSKNLSGGVFYCRVMEEVFPNFAEVAPVERKITRNCICLLNEQSQVEINYRDQRLAEPTNAVTVLRAKLDAWLAEQCEEAGVSVVPGMHVDRLLKEDGRICGVGIDQDELRAKVVVAADGVNSFIARSIGLRSKEPNHHMAVGVKSVIGLPEETIAQRFGLQGNEGAAWAVVGDCTAGVGGGGFMYTNRDSISIGVVLRLDDLVKRGLKSSELHDRFINHPYIQPYLKDGKLLEYGCHMVAEGGYQMLGKQVTDGMIVVGDAAGFTLNTGLTVRGMDLAAGSGIAAAKAVTQALEAQDYSRETLGAYTRFLDETFVGQDMKTYRYAPDFLETPEMYGEVGQLAADVLYGAFNHDLTPRKHLAKVAIDAFKKSRISLRRLALIGWKGVKSL